MTRGTKAAKATKATKATKARALPAATEAAPRASAQPRVGAASKTGAAGSPARRASAGAAAVPAPSARAAGKRPAARKAASAVGMPNEVAGNAAPTKAAATSKASPKQSRLAVDAPGKALAKPTGKVAEGKKAATAQTARAPVPTEVVDAVHADPGSADLVETQIGPLEISEGRPAYWEEACADLMRRDRIMKKLIPRFSRTHLIGRGEPFETLARSVVGQQISVKAADAIWHRLLASCPGCEPATVHALGVEQLAACGLSKRKAEYVFDLSRHFVDGSLHPDAWSTMDDEAVIAELTQIRGIGRWTAEMFLIFNLRRPDVLPLDDFGLLRAISVNYFSGEPVTRSEAREVAANWEPWRTVATWYLWRSLDPIPRMT
nr:DNA-3-methyladenine glycosylase [Chitinasiproducens palmae]